MNRKEFWALTSQGKPGTRPPSCTSPQQLTMHIVLNCYLTVRIWNVRKGKKNRKNYGGRLGGWVGRKFVILCTATESKIDWQFFNITENESACKTGCEYTEKGFNYIFLLVVQCSAVLKNYTLALIMLFYKCFFFFLDTP